MCGLIYAKSFNGQPVNELVWKQFENQRARGTQGFGFFNGRHIIKAAIEKRIKHKLKSNKHQSDLLLFHHRWPTSTVNEKKGAHPYNTGSHFGDTRYVLIHNGRIRNSHELRQKHEAAGIAYQSVFADGTFNDSESLLWDFALTMEGKQDKLKAYGDIAFICIKIESGKPTKLYYGRNFGRPLKMVRNKLGMLLSSEGNGDDVPVNELYTFNYQHNRLTHRPFKVPAVDPEYVATTYSYAGRYSADRYASNYQRSHNVNVCGGYDAAQWEDNYYIGDDGLAHYYDDEDEYLEFDEEEEDVHYEVWDAENNEWVSERRNVVREIPTLSDLLPKPVTDEEVLNLVWQELAYADGHFNTAYWRLEQQYDAIEQQTKKSLEMVRKLHLVSRAVDELNEMEYFEDENSYHPMWGEQPLLTGGKTG